MNTARDFKNCYIKKFPIHYTDQDLYNLFSKYGHPISCKVAKDKTGKSKGFGFCSFGSHEEAVRAVMNIDGLDFNGKQIVCKPFIPKEIHSRTINMSQCRNLRVDNLDSTVTKEELYEVFSQFGDIESAIVMLNNNGRSKGYGYVCFKRVEDAEECFYESYSIEIHGIPCEVQLDKNHSNIQSNQRNMQLNQFNINIRSNMQYDQINNQYSQSNNRNSQYNMQNQTNIRSQPNIYYDQINISKIQPNIPYVQHDMPYIPFGIPNNQPNMHSQLNNQNRQTNRNRRPNNRLANKRYF